MHMLTMKVQATNLKYKKYFRMAGYSFIGVRALMALAALGILIYLMSVRTPRGEPGMSAYSYSSIVTLGHTLNNVVFQKSFLMKYRLYPSIGKRCLCTIFGP